MYFNNFFLKSLFYENNVTINLKIIILIYTSRILYNNGKKGIKLWKYMKVDAKYN